MNNVKLVIESNEFKKELHIEKSKKNNAGVEITLSKKYEGVYFVAFYSHDGRKLKGL
jgi:hypothetical protein